MISEAKARRISVLYFVVIGSPFMWRVVRCPVVRVDRGGKFSALLASLSASMFNFLIG